MTPLVAWIMVGFFREIPREMEEAALIDGCSQWGLFWRVVVPVAAPGLVAVAILNFIGGWNEFLFSLILTSRDIQTSRFLHQQGQLWGEMAAGVTASIPTDRAEAAGPRPHPRRRAVGRQRRLHCTSTARWSCRECCEYGCGILTKPNCIAPIWMNEDVSANL